MSNTHEGYINVPQQLPPEACKVYLFHDMQSSLVSIGLLCDAGCIATFDKDTISIHKDGVVILQGKRDPTTGLWTVDLNAQPAPPALSNMSPCPPSQQRLSGNVLLFYTPAPDPLQSPHSEKP
jgi:hypothetical protein